MAQNLVVKGYTVYEGKVISAYAAAFCGNDGSRKDGCIMWKNTAFPFRRSMNLFVNALRIATKSEELTCETVESVRFLNDQGVNFKNISVLWDESKITFWFEHRHYTRKFTLNAREHIVFTFNGFKYEAVED